MNNLKIVKSSTGKIYYYNKNNYETFKNRYHEDIYFKEKHLKYCNEKIKCKTCNKLVSRSNMSRHKKCIKHIKLVLSNK